MLIVCPSCASTYTIEPEMLGPRGRRVRCAACRVEWFVDRAAAIATKPLDDGPAAETDRDVAAAAGTIADAGADGATQDTAEGRPSGGAPQGVADGPLRQAEVAEAQVATGVIPHEGEAAVAIVPGRDIAIADVMRFDRGPDEAVPPVDPPDLRIRPRAGGPGLGARLARPLRKMAKLAAACLLIFVLGVVVFDRDGVVSRLPGAAGLYAAAGMPVNLRGLEFRAIRSELAVEADSPTLMVEGEVLNVARNALDLPPISVAIRDKSGQALYTWTVDPPRQRLEAGESVSFRSRVAMPPSEGHDVFLRFSSSHDRLAGVQQTR